MLSVHKLIGLALFLLSMSVQADSITNNQSSHSFSSGQPSVDPSSQCVVVTGSAETKGVSEYFARKMAIRDALKMASLNNVNIQTDQSVEQFQLTLDSARFTSNSKIKSFTLLKEGTEDPFDMYGADKKGPLNYEVTLNVCLTEEQGVCDSLTGKQYQARIAVAPVVIPNPGEARDISNLLFGYQQELERRIRNSGYRNFTLLKTPVDLQHSVMVTPNLDPEVLADVRDRTGAQYLLLTVIRSLSAHNESSVLNSAKRFYNLEVKPESRFIESDWYLIDLMTVTLEHQARGGFDVKGDVTVGRNKPFGTNAFFSTDIGMAFHALLENQTRDVLQFMHCKPFESQIVDIRDGEYIIYLNAESGVQVGDDLAVFHKTGRPVRFNGVLLGSDQQPGAFLKIKRIFPRFAIAEIAAKKGLVQVGDVVKAW